MFGRKRPQLAEGLRVDRYTNAGSAISVGGAGVAVTLTDTLMDAEDTDLGGFVSWDAANDRFSILAPGLYRVKGLATFDLSAETAGRAQLVVLVSGTNAAGSQAEVPCNSYDMDVWVDFTTHLPAGATVTLQAAQTSGTSHNVTYGELLLELLVAG